MVSKNSIEAITKDNFHLVRAYIDWALESGRMKFSQWPIDNFRKIPRESSPEAIDLLEAWIARHLLLDTRRKMFANIREAAFEAAKGSVQISISTDTRELLRERRNAEFGENRGSMEITIRTLLDGAKRMLPEDGFRQLEAYRQRNGLDSIAAALQALLDRSEEVAGVQSREMEEVPIPAIVEVDAASEPDTLDAGQPSAPGMASANPRHRRELEHLLAALKGEAPWENPAPPA